MSLLPDSVDFRATAASSAAKARGVAPIILTSNGLDVATALKCMSSYQLEETANELQALDDENNAAPLIAAARTLQSTAEHLSLSEGPNEERFNELMLYASVAHAMCGNFPSARAALEKVAPLFQLSSPMRYIASVVCDSTGSLATASKDVIDGIEGFRHYWFHALRKTTSQERNQALRQANLVLQKVAVERSTSGDRALALSIEVAMKQASRLATASLFEMAPEIPSWFVSNSIQTGIVTLLPPQYELLAVRRVARTTGNALFTLPTSTGKTLIAEACMATASDAGGISIYIAPYVAIGDQVRMSLEKKTTGRIPLLPMFGGFKTSSLAETGDNALLVMTPERFDGWLRTGEFLDALRLVIFDEIHIVENDTRGARVEGLISRLRLLQRRLPRLRIVGLSAVLAKPDRVCRWMGVEEQENLHSMSWRPTARRVAICRSDGTMYWLHGADTLRPSNLRPSAPLSGLAQVALPEIVRPALNPVLYERQASKNVAAVAKDLLQRLGSPGLVVCRRRVDTRLLAVSLAADLPALQEATVESVADDIVTRYSWLAPLANCVRHGVAYHNASLPYDIRREIEQLTRFKKLRVVCSTTTLAEGADLPFRWTLVAHHLAGDGTPLKSMTFRNIAGRNGRAGAFTEGDTVLFENNGGPPESYWNVAPVHQLHSIMFEQHPIESTGGHLYTLLPDGKRAAVQSVFASQLLASIKENSGEEDIVGLLSNATYAAQDEIGSNIDTLLQDSVTNLLDANRPGGALAVMNSPIRLTPLGEAANLSGFSPNSVRAMLVYLTNLSILPPPSELKAELLLTFGNLDEQPENLWRKISAGSSTRHPLKANDMKVVLEKIAQRQDMRSIFEELPARKKSKANPDNVEKQFDSFVSLIDSVIANYLPWLLRALSGLAQFGSTTSQSVNWIHLANDVEASFGTESSDDALGEE